MNWLQVNEETFKDFMKHYTIINTTHRKGFKYYVTFSNKSISKVKDGEYYILKTKYDSYLTIKICQGVQKHF